LATGDNKDSKAQKQLRDSHLSFHYFDLFENCCHFDLTPPNLRENGRTPDSGMWPERGIVRLQLCQVNRFTDILSILDYRKYCHSNAESALNTAL
jgi:hypothetical protein